MNIQLVLYFLTKIIQIYIEFSIYALIFYIISMIFNINAEDILDKIMLFFAIIFIIIMTFSLYIKIDFD